MDGSDSAIDRKAVLQLAGRAGLAPEAVPADSRLVERAVAPFLAEVRTCRRLPRTPQRADCVCGQLLRNATTLAQHWCRVDVLASDIEDAVALHHRASAASTSFMLFEHDAEDDCEADSDWEGSSMSGSEDDSSDEAESELSSILSDSDASYLSSQSLDEVALQLESLSGLVLSDTHLERLIGLAGVLALTLTPEARLLCRVLLENNLVAALQGETNWCAPTPSPTPRLTRRSLGVDLRVLCRLRLLEERASLTPVRTHGALSSPHPSSHVV